VGQPILAAAGLSGGLGGRLPGTLRVSVESKIDERSFKKMRNIPLAFVFLLSSCAARRASLAPPQPGVPDGSAPVWVDLRPGMELKIEGAYYREGSPRRGVTDYLGAETATYEIHLNGALRLGSVSSFLDGQTGKEQPRDQPAVQLLIRPRNMSYRYHRLFFQLLMSRTGAIRPAVLIGSRSIAELDRLTTQLLAGQDAVCGRGSTNQCTAFPPMFTASVAIEIVVNGAARKVTWGSTLGSIAAHPRHVELLRISNGRLAPLQVDVTDPEALRLPLLHGDQVSWN
jgi:hypothetical protein